MELILATSNKGKVKEISYVLGNLGYTIITMAEEGLDIEIIEDGETYEQNAIKKAKTIMELTGKIAMADDSGLEIDFLDNSPGVYSARFLGEDTPYDVKNPKILDMLKDVSVGERGARFVSVIAVAYPNGDIITAKGVLEGEISQYIRGTNGFGYDPIFYLRDHGVTSAEMPPELKNKISHRAKALQLIKTKMENYQSAKS